VQLFQASGFMLRSGGEISNFTTRMTPRYWAWISGCELLDCLEGARWAEALPSAKSARPIPAKIMNTLSNVRRLKNADGFVDFLFIMTLVEDCSLTSKHFAGPSLERSREKCHALSSRKARGR
jgi:hypothetical protein